MRKEGLDLVLQAAGSSGAAGDEYASVWRPGMPGAASGAAGAGAPAPGAPPPAAGPPPAW
jgi:hypothetical protein